MRNVTGDAKLIQEVQNAGAGDPSIYVNFERLSEMPDEFEAVITKVTFDVPKDKDRPGSFSWVGGANFMPSPDLMYKIAEARGISGDTGEVISISEEIDINPMLMKPLDAPPTIQRRQVGYSARKTSVVTEEDGSIRRSSLCEIMYNAWIRACENWSKYPDDKKYATPALRMANFQSELKFAQTKAQTKAHLKTIRELAGLKTGYTIEDLKKGYFVFAKIRKSQKMIKAEAMARLSFIATGGVAQIAPPPPVDPAPEETVEYPPSPPPVEDPHPPAEEHDNQDEPEWSRLVSALKFYTKEGLISNVMLKGVPLADVISKLVEWLEREKEKAEAHLYWSTAIERLKFVESSIDEPLRYRHGIEY